MADQNRNDAAGERQNQPRRGLEGRDLDAGTGSGRAGESREETSIPRGTDEHSDDAAGRDRNAAGRDPRGVDLDGPLGGERRDPGH